MDGKIKKRWLRLLRSGKVKQHHGSLCSPDHKAFCCLGVLDGLRVGPENVASDNVVLNFDTRAWAGVSSSNLYVTVDALLEVKLKRHGLQKPPSRIGLDTLNDGTDDNERRFKPFTFREIATVAERLL